MKTLILPVLLCCFLLPATAQKYLTITEHDPDKPDAVHINNAITDIGSTLDIKINKSALFQKLVASGAYKVPDETARVLDMLKTALERQSSMLDEVKTQLAGYNPADSAKSLQFNAVMASFANDALAIFQADPVTMNYYIMDLVSDPFTGVSLAIQKRLDDLEKQLSALNAGSPKKLQLGAWISTKTTQTPLHLEGFDTNPNLEYYEVNRWQIVPTPAQLKQYEEMQQLAKANRDKGLASLQLLLNQNINAFIKSFNDIAAIVKQDVLTEYERIKTIVNDSAVTADIKKVQESYQQLENFVNPLITKYAPLLSPGGLNNQALIQSLLADLPILTGKMGTLKTTITTAVTRINTLAVNVRNSVNVSNFIRSLEAKLQTITLNLDGTGINALIQSIKVDEAVLVFTDKVLSFSLNDLPESTTLNLNNTGARESGDKIVFILREYDSVTKKSSTLEMRTLTMYQIVPHIYGIASVVFAHPFSGNTALESNFQMQPSYSFLLKGVWPWTQKYYRKSNIRNMLTDFSYGIHIGAPDFDKDDVPEIGVGIVLSGLHDYIQLGLANNLFKGNWYWFFGIRLPVPTLSLSGATTSGKTGL